MGFSGDAGKDEAEFVGQLVKLRLSADTRPPLGRRRSVADALRRRSSSLNADTQLLQVHHTLS